MQCCALADHGVDSYFSLGIPSCHIHRLHCKSHHKNAADKESGKNVKEKKNLLSSPALISHSDAYCKQKTRVEWEANYKVWTKYEDK